MNVEEEVLWLPMCSADILRSEDTSDWLAQGPRKKEIADETTFCDPSVLKEILSAKVSMCSGWQTL